MFFFLIWSSLIEGNSWPRLQRCVQNIISTRLRRLHFILPQKQRRHGYYPRATGWFSGGVRGQWGAATWVPVAAGHLWVTGEIHSHICSVLGRVFWFSCLQRGASPGYSIGFGRYGMIIASLFILNRIREKQPVGGGGRRWSEEGGGVQGAGVAITVSFLISKNLFFFKFPDLVLFYDECIGLKNRKWYYFTTNVLGWRTEKFFKTFLVKFEHAKKRHDYPKKLKNNKNGA